MAGRDRLFVSSRVCVLVLLCFLSATVREQPLQVPTTIFSIMCFQSGLPHPDGLSLY